MDQKVREISEKLFRTKYDQLVATPQAVDQSRGQPFIQKEKGSPVESQGICGL